jgi:Zn-dependent peptidase ImmA (M78 family)
LLAHVEARRPVLVLNSRLAAVDRNHTAAHELGHWLLHAGRTNSIGTHSNRQLQEWEANKFADELLLPEELVRRVISERRCSIGAAALRLGVRGTYLSRRIRELKLVGQPFLRRGSPVRGFSDTM